MAESDFRFKQFSIRQDYSAMRVNTDAVLLGAWMSMPEHSGAFMLDIGTGTGVIALMAAQRANAVNIDAQIDAVEIESKACIDAANNFNNAPWKNIGLNLHNCSIQSFAGGNNSGKYNLIFSNPPYFTDSLKNPNKDKVLARHSDSLSQADLLSSVGKLLKTGGRFAIVLPAEQAQEFLRKTEFLVKTIAGKEYPVLYPVRICKVKTTERKEPKRYLMEFEYAVVNSAEDIKTNTIEETLVMLNNGVYTNEYKKLTMDFYLYF